jgi:RND family efflux transporter MFP subunit
LKKLIILISLTTVVLLSLSMVPQAVALSYLPVKAFIVEGSDVTSTVECSGTVQANVKQDICFGCPIKITKSYVEVGDYVKKGERLFDIDKNVTLQALLNNGGSDADTNSTAQTGSNSSSVNTSAEESALQQALSSGVIGQDTYNSLIGQVRAGNSLNNANSATVSSSSQNSNETDSEKIVNNIEANLYAPISGVVTDMTDTGDGMTPASTSLIQITDFSSLQVMAQIKEDDLKNVKMGQPAFITGSGFNGNYNGIVSRIYPSSGQVQTDSGSENMVNIIISINNLDKNLRPGLDTNVTIKTAVRDGTIVVPFESILQDDNGQEYVFVFKNGRAIRQNITTGDEYDTGVEVLTGITAGETIIDDPPDSLSNGSNISIKS